MKICYIGNNETARESIKNFCEGYECSLEYSNANTDKELVMTLKKAFKDDLIIVNVNDLHKNHIGDDFICECLTQYKELKSELILYTDGYHLPIDIINIGYAMVSDAISDRNLKKLFAAYGFKTVPKVEDNLFSSLTQAADEEVSSNLFGDIVPNESPSDVKNEINKDLSALEEKEVKKGSESQEKTETLPKKTKKPKPLNMPNLSKESKPETSKSESSKSEKEIHKPRVIGLEEKESNIKTAESPKTPESVTKPVKENIKDSEKSSEEKSEVKTVKKPVPLSSPFEQIDKIFEEMPVHMAKISESNGSSKQPKFVPNSQNQQQKAESVQQNSSVMNTAPIENVPRIQVQHTGQTVDLQQHSVQNFSAKSDFDIPAQKRTIGVIGTIDRIGTTTQAIQLTRFLSDRGKIICYVQDNNSNFLDLLTKYYYGVNVDTGSECILYDGLYLNRKKNLVYDREYEVEVYDYGCSQNIPSDFFNRDIRIVVCGGSPEEIDRLTAMIPQLYSDDKIYYVFSFVAHHDKQNILDIMIERKANCYFAPYSPDCFAHISDECADMYYDILGIDKPQKKKGLFRRGKNKDAKV